MSLRNRIHRWRLSAALDAPERELPATTRRALEHSPELRDHQERLLRLDDQLRNEARAWRREAGADEGDALDFAVSGAARRDKTKSAPTPSRSRVWGAWGAWGLGLAAASLAVVLLLRPEGREQHQVATGEKAVSSPAVGPEPGVATDAPDPGAASSLARAIQSPIDSFATRARALSFGALDDAADERLLGEVRNVARDARRLASLLAGHVRFAGGRRGADES